MKNGNYFINFWGGGEGYLKETLGNNSQNYWFKTKQERDVFKSKITKLCNDKGLVIVYHESEGEITHYRTVATMKLVLPNGEVYNHTDDFGYGYDKESAEFMYFDGNYSCDCNKSLFLIQQGVDIEEYECGDEILIKDFKITFEE